MKPGLQPIIARLGNRCVAVVEFGSRLYGTALPSSDWDYKGIMLPTAEEILMCEPASGFTERTNPSDAGVKNGPDDVDVEFFSLYRFLELLMEGQTVAIDMLFTPKQHILESTPVFRDIFMMRDMFLNRHCGKAIGYAKSQAHKYSLRGDRIQALETIVDALRSRYELSPRDTLGEWLNTYSFHAGNLIDSMPEKCRQHVRFTREEAPTLPGGALEHLEVCGKKAGLTSSVKFAYELWSKVLAEYGERARAAREAGGADWKAMYHALRIASQTVELLLTGNVTFPRPDAEYLLKVRRGEVRVEEVSEAIEQGLVEIRKAQENSVLRRDPNRGAARQFIMDVHTDVLKSHRRFHG
jgi:hypothetical protein